MNILVIGAHPDDYELGMGGTILHHINKGDKVFAVVATNGEKLADPERRKKETEEAGIILGIQKIFFFDIKDTQISSGSETIELIENVIEEVKPDRVYSHSMDDTHQDHRNLSKASLAAARKIKQILFYEAPSSHINFAPNYFVDIAPFLDKKVEALKVHKSVLEHGEKDYLAIDSIKGGSFFRGYQANLKYAEGFEIFRLVE
jgi:LmbE family N-acetylglucosaminyl deacetylase